MSITLDDSETNVNPYTGKKIEVKEEEKPKLKEEEKKKASSDESTSKA